MESAPATTISVPGAGAERSTSSSAPRPERLFAAIVPPAESLATLERAVERERRDAVAAVRWTPREQWHVTLVFMGAVDASLVPAVTDALRATAAGTAALRLQIARAGAFPRARGARVLWAGLQGQRSELAALAKACRAAVRDTGVECADGTFRPHLTVARARGVLDARSLVAALDQVAGPAWVANEVVLFRSQLGQGEAGRARHEEVARLPLDAADG